MKQVLLNKYLLSELHLMVSFIKGLTIEESSFSASSQCSWYACHIVKNSGFHLVLDANLL